MHCPLSSKGEGEGATGWRMLEEEGRGREFDIEDSVTGVKPLFIQKSRNSFFIHSIDGV